MSIIKKLLSQNQSFIDKELAYVETIQNLSKANRELSEKLQVVQTQASKPELTVEEVTNYRPINKVVTFSELRDNAEDISRKEADAKVVSRDDTRHDGIVH